MVNCHFRRVALVGATLVAVSVCAGEPAIETPVALGRWETQAVPAGGERLPEPKPGDWKANGSPHTWNAGDAMSCWMRSRFVLGADRRDASVVFQS